RPLVGRTRRGGRRSACPAEPRKPGKMTPFSALPKLPGSSSFLPISTRANRLHIHAWSLRTIGLQLRSQPFHDAGKEALGSDHVVMAPRQVADSHGQAALLGAIQETLDLAIDVVFVFAR